MIFHDRTIAQIIRTDFYIYPIVTVFPYDRLVCINIVGTIRIIEKIRTINCKISLTLFLAGYSCGGIRTQVAGVISSSNFPRNYKPNVTCTWKITVASANQITLNFTDFELHNSSTCEHAYVRVFDGLNTTSPSLGKFCGREIPMGVQSSGNTMLVVFKSFRGDEFRGFRAYYDSGEY